MVRFSNFFLDGVVRLEPNNQIQTQLVVEFVSQVDTAREHEFTVCRKMELCLNSKEECSDCAGPACDSANPTWMSHFLGLW